MSLKSMIRSVAGGPKNGKTRLEAETVEDDEEDQAEGDPPKEDDDEETAEGDDAPKDDEDDAPPESARSSGGVSASVAKKVLELPSAKGREKLAHELAFTPGMTVKTADRLMSAAPKGGGRLAEAMAGRDVNPGAGGGGGGKGDVADRMAANFASAGGSTRLRKV